MGQPVVPQIDAMALCKPVADEIQQLIVEVVAAQCRVAVAGQHFDDAAFTHHNGNVESSTAQIVNEDVFWLLTSWIVCQRSRGRLIENSHDLEPREFAGL